MKAINKKGGKRVKSAKSKKVDVLTKESKRVFDEPKDEEITEEVPETKKDLFDGDDDEGKFLIFDSKKFLFLKKKNRSKIIYFEKQWIYQMILDQTWMMMKMVSWATMILAVMVVMNLRKTT